MANLMLSVSGASRISSRSCSGNASARVLPYFPPIHSKSTSKIALKGSSWIATVTEVVEWSLDLAMVRTKNSINEQRAECERPD